jgi:hypothetical protein
MKECVNSKIRVRISSNFILSIYLLIMSDTLLIRPSLHCNISLHFTTLHPTTLHYTYRHFTSFYLHFTTISFGLTHLPFLSLYFTSHHQTRHSAIHISKLISKIMNPLTALKNLSPFHFTSLFIFFTYPINHSLHFTLLFISTNHFPSLITFYRLHFPSLVFTSLTLVLKICGLPWEVPVAPSSSKFQSVMDLFTNLILVHLLVLHPETLQRIWKR